MPRPGTIRLLLVDDHSVVRMGLVAVLGVEPDVRVVAEAEDGEQALRAYRPEDIDVVLLDIRMPGLSGIATLQQLKARHPDVKVLMLTTSELDDDIQRVFAAGAAGYLFKSVQREELVQAIRLIHQGGHYLNAAVRQKLQELARTKHLSEREEQILDGMRRGLSNRDIAVAHEISEHTVKTHVKSILQKLESADRAEAVARGFEKGLLRVPDR